MKPLYYAIGGVVVVGLGLLLFVGRPDPLIGTTVRVPIAAASQLSLSTTFPIVGLTGTMLVQVTSVAGDVVSGVVQSFDGFDTVRGVKLPVGLLVTFSRSSITK